MSRLGSPYQQDDPVEIRFDFLLPYQGWYSNIRPPLLRFEVVSKGKTFPTLGCVDSGAVGIIMHADVGTQVGLDVYAGREHLVGGIDRELTGYDHPVTISVPDLDWVTVVEVTFVPGYHREYALLGREGFLNKWKVAFRDRHQQMYFALEAELYTAKRSG